MKHDNRKYDDLESLLEHICEFTHIEAGSKRYSQDLKLLRFYIFKRVDFLVEMAKCYIVEDNYTEEIWTDMYGMYYVETSFSNYGSKTMRVHIFCDDTDLSSANYLGFFTLRPIPIPSYMLGTVMVNWGVAAPKLGLSIMSFPLKVHVYDDSEFTTWTYPFVAQDGIVLTCSEVNILTLSTFMNQKYGFALVRIHDIYESFSPSFIPSRGMSTFEMMQVLTANKIKVRYEDSQPEYTQALYMAILGYIHSELPVLLIFDRHVLSVIGTKIVGDKEHLVVYDDSGAYIKNGIFGFIDEKVFTDLCLYQDLKHEHLTVLVPVFPGVYNSIYEYVKTSIYTRKGFQLRLENLVIVTNRNIRQILIRNRPYLCEKALSSDRLEKLIAQDYPNYYLLALAKPSKADDRRHYVLVIDSTYPANEYSGGVELLVFEPDADFTDAFSLYMKQKESK